MEAVMAATEAATAAPLKMATAAAALSTASTVAEALAPLLMEIMWALTSESKLGSAAMAAKTRKKVAVATAAAVPCAAA